MNTYQTILNIYPFHRILSIFHYSHQRKSPFPGKTGFIPPEKAIPEGTGKRPPGKIPAALLPFPPCSRVLPANTGKTFRTEKMRGNADDQEHTPPFKLDKTIINTNNQWP